jgi:hypothetical protein
VSECLRSAIAVAQQGKRNRKPSRSDHEIQVVYGPVSPESGR